MQGLRRCTGSYRCRKETCCIAAVSASLCMPLPVCSSWHPECPTEHFQRFAGQLNSNGNQLLVFGKQFGNVFIGVQPTFGYEGDPMRLLFSKSASPHHGFAAFYTYLEKIFKVRISWKPSDWQTLFRI